MRPTNSLLGQLRQLVLRHLPDGLTDAQLLEAFLTRHEEDAFAALMQRHGPMVFGVCRRILGNCQDAEDVFQTTFLVLLRKASSIRPEQGVGPWLHGVAQRTAQRARQKSARQRAGQKRFWQRALRENSDSHASEDWRPLLDEEISRLPEKYRIPIVLCDLQGRTHKEAAGELGWPQGTLSGRLWRARTLLARRLTRRGLELSTTVTALAFAEEAAFAGTTALLIRTTTKMAKGILQGGTVTAGAAPATVAALTQGGLQIMGTSKMTIASALLLSAGLATGVFLYATRTPAQAQTEKSASASAEFVPPPAAAKTPESVPSTRDLIEYLNNNARLAEGLRCSVSMTCRADRQTVGLVGTLVCRRPRHVHLHAKVLGQHALDLGCNDKEYWCWLSHGESALRQGRRDEEVRPGPRNWSLSVRPEWLLDVLGIAEYDAEKTYSLRATQKHLELSEIIQSPQGQPLHKVIVFHRSLRPGGCQIAAVVVKDTDDKVLCRADIKKVYHDKETGSRVTEKAVLSFPRQRVRVDFSLDHLRLTKLAAEKAAVVFAPKSAPFAAKSTSDVDAKKSAPVIQIELTKEHMQVRYLEDVLKLSGRADSSFSLRLLRELLHAWAGKEKQAAVCIRCDADIKYKTVKAVLAACREAGFHKIEIGTLKDRVGQEKE